MGRLGWGIAGGLPLGAPVPKLRVRKRPHLRRVFERGAIPIQHRTPRCAGCRTRTPKAGSDATEPMTINPTLALEQKSARARTGVREQEIKA
jgi:hypothetical protein